MDRVKKILTETCRCERSTCFNRFDNDHSDINKFLDTFWSLEKPAQDAYAWVLFFELSWVWQTFVSLCLNYMFTSNHHMYTSQIPTSYVYLKFYLTEIYETMRGTRRGARAWSFLGKKISYKCIAAIWGDQAPKICKSWVRFTGSTIPMLWCWNQADFRNMFKTLRLQWSNWSNLVSYCYFWLLFLWFMTSTTQEKKRKPLQYMKLDKFFMMLYIKQAGMLPTRCLSQTDKLIGFVHP